MLIVGNLARIIRIVTFDHLSKRSNFIHPYIDFIFILFLDESAVSSLFASVEKKKVHRSDQEIKTMPTKQFLDEMVVPILNKALLKVNKEVRSLLVYFQLERLFNKHVNLGLLTWSKIGKIILT